ncbi:unnamed protein product [Moneuplotes crassus]|uniref:Uncharacterized protein n=1 Tax=Euplotes crassus TaxID=5936 RepID=A0AAD1U7S6_EUPCR|nr:unnamed protein product [Moneuplotes crassus]
MSITDEESSSCNTTEIDEKVDEDYIKGYYDAESPKPLTRRPEARKGPTYYEFSPKRQSFGSGKAREPISFYNQTILKLKTPLRKRNMYTSSKESRKKSALKKRKNANKLCGPTKANHCYYASCSLPYSSNLKASPVRKQSSEKTKPKKRQHSRIKLCQKPLNSFNNTLSSKPPLPLQKLKSQKSPNTSKCPQSSNKIPFLPSSFTAALNLSTKKTKKAKCRKMKTSKPEQLYSRNKLILDKSSKSVTNKPPTTLQIVKEFINNGGLARPKIDVKPKRKCRNRAKARRKCTDFTFRGSVSTVSNCGFPATTIRCIQ